MYPSINIFSGIANIEAICFAKMVVYLLLLAVSTDVTCFMFHETSCRAFRSEHRQYVLNVDREK